MLVQSIQGDAPVVPETEEYGISSFVYRSRRPFHPQRLHAFMKQFYTLQEEEMQDEEEEDGDAEGMQEGSEEGGEYSMYVWACTDGPTQDYLQRQIKYQCTSRKGVRRQTLFFSCLIRAVMSPVPVFC